MVFQVQMQSQYPKMPITQYDEYIDYGVLASIIEVFECYSIKVSNEMFRWPAEKVYINLN